jgi:hypothetical protein
MMNEREEMQEWYLEYQIHKDRPGLLGDIASMLGMLNINIITINGVENQRRAFLLQCDTEQKMEFVANLLKQINNITVTALRHPSLIDRMVIRHGRYISRDVTDRKTFRFCREDLGLLVDFLGEICKRDGHQLIGVRGMPRVGKTESIIAASVNANKRWNLLSSTLLRQTVRTMLAEGELSPEFVYIIDGIVTCYRSNEKHQSLVREIMRLNATKVIEHPDIFIRETEYNWDDFDYIIEIRNHPDEEISYDLINTGFNSFDMS